MINSSARIRRFFQKRPNAAIFDANSAQLVGINQCLQYKEVSIMKTAIQPKFYEAQVKCSCGNEFVTGSTKENIHVEVCSKCHPFYTGSQKMLLEAGGRVEKFKKKYNR